MVKPAVLTICLLFAVAVFVACIGPVQAARCDHGPCCDQDDITGPIVMPDHNDGSDLNLGGFSVLSGILAIGQGLRGGSNKASAAMNKNAEAQNAYIRQLIAGMGTAREKSDNMEMFGPGSRAYNTAGKFGSGVQVGIGAQKHLSGKIRDDIHTYSRQFDSRKKILERLRGAPAGNKYGAADTMSLQELAASKEIAKTVINPFPALDLNENLDQGRTAEGYKSTRKAKDARLLLPIGVLSDLIAEQAPVLNLEGWPGQMHERLGGEGEPLRAEDGKLSMNGLIGMLADMRFANQDWLAGENGIHGMTYTGVLRELLMAKVDKLMVQYRRMLWLDRMAALMAQKQLPKDKELDHALDHAKTNLFR